MITVFVDNKEVPVNMVEFSDGALTFKLDQMPTDPSYISINVDPSTPVYRVREEIILIVEALGGLVEDGYLVSDGEPKKFILNLPYLPYARCDRRFEKGNPVALESFLNTEHLELFNEIHICDIHNMKALEDFHSLSIIEKPQLECFKSSLPQDFVNDYDLVVSPDVGATEKAKTIADYLGVDIIYATKVRDVSTGKLVDMTLPEGYDLQGKKVLIPDDIFDGGSTFLWLAGLLRSQGASEVDLYVTHLIASKGLKCCKGKIDKLICYQTVAGYINKQNVTDFNNGRY